MGSGPRSNGTLGASWAPPWPCRCRPGQFTLTEPALPPRQWLREYWGFWTTSCLLCVLSVTLVVCIYLFMSTIFTSLINRCLGIFLLGFSLYGILCTSWTWVIFFLSHVREVFNYNLFKYFLWPFLSSPSESLIMWILVCLMLSQRSLTLSSFLFFLFSLLCSWQWFQPFCLSSHLFILLPQLFCYWFLLVYFSFQDYIVHLFFCPLIFYPLLNTPCNFSVCASIHFLRS